MQTIGERLEEARKKKGISIREAAEATKIRGDYLQKFEGNQFDIGLSEIYVRGFLRNYAGFLKIASDRIISDYTALGRGDAKSARPPIRDGYGRTPIVPGTTEAGEHAAPPILDGSLDSSTGRTAPRKRSSAPSLPTGPDPAVVFKYVKIGGGVSTVRQYLLAGAIDELHLALSPVLLGRGESLFAGLDLPGLGYRVAGTVPTELATHLVLTR